MTTTISLMIGLCGLFLAIVSHRWNRRESRLHALSEILEVMLRAMRKLLEANNTRRTCERLKVAYPDPHQAPEAVIRVNELTTKYNDYIKTGQADCAVTENLIAARRFRFPDRIAKLLHDSNDTLFAVGRAVQDGRFEEADVLLAKMRDQYKEIMVSARGWRLSDPFESIRNKFRIKPGATKPPAPFGITESRMKRILDLVHKRATTQDQNCFVVHPPQKLLDNPKLAQSDNVITALGNEVFSVIFQDGASENLTLAELLVFVYQLITLAQHWTRVNNIFSKNPAENPIEINVSVAFNLNDIMRPEMAKMLLTKVEFSSVAANVIYSSIA